MFLVMSSDGFLLHVAGHAGTVGLAVDVLSVVVTGIEALSCSRTCTSMYVLHSICMHERGSEARKPVMAAFLLHAWIADDGSSRFTKLMGGGRDNEEPEGSPRRESHLG